MGNEKVVAKVPVNGRIPLNIGAQPERKVNQSIFVSKEQPVSTHVEPKPKVEIKQQPRVLPNTSQKLEQNISKWKKFGKYFMLGSGILALIAGVVYLSTSGKKYYDENIKVVDADESKLTPEEDSIIRAVAKTNEQILKNHEKYGIEDISYEKLDLTPNNNNINIIDRLKNIFSKKSSVKSEPKTKVIGNISEKDSTANKKPLYKFDYSGMSATELINYINSQSKRYVGADAKKEKDEQTRNTKEQKVAEKPMVVNGKKQETKAAEKKVSEVKPEEKKAPEARTAAEKKVAEKKAAEKKETVVSKQTAVNEYKKTKENKPAARKQNGNTPENFEIVKQGDCAWTMAERYLRKNPEVYKKIKAELASKLGYEPNKGMIISKLTNELEIRRKTKIKKENRDLVIQGDTIDFTQVIRKIA